MNKPMTLSEIAEELGISRQAVAEILQKAYKKIRKALKNKGFEKEDLF
jgi:DNA-directed RNA polymerase sigma subunit (sigma70/sigma32)